MKPNEKESTFVKRDTPTAPAAPVIGVSGVPVDHVTFDLTVPKEASTDSAPEQIPIPSPAPVAQEVPTEQMSEQATEQPEQASPAPATVEIIGIRFKKNGKIYYFDPHGICGRVGQSAIVETARGQEYGEIALGNTRVPENEIVPPIRPMLRIATEADSAHFLENRKKEEEAFSICLTKIEAHKLDMKLVEAQYTFDNSKLLFYFTSAGRVDFRELVKDLASVFRTRIELRQIGIRDEAKLVGGIGSCGRALCCARFLTDFGQVSIKMAKEQNLSLNSTKISGTCGRLMCCLRYEYEAYLEEIRLTPPVDSVVKTPDGIGTVIEIAPLTGMLKVRLQNNPDTPVQSYHRDTVTVCTRGASLSDAEDRPVKESREEDVLKEKIDAFTESENAREITARHTSIPSERAERKEWSDTPLFRKPDETRENKNYPPRPQKKRPDSGRLPKEPTRRDPMEEPLSSRNRIQTQQNQQNRAKGQGHPRKRPGGKPQNRSGKGDVNS